MSAGRSRPDVAIVGGGIVGTALAAFLADAGASVRLYERAGIAAGASGRNSGMVQHPFDGVLADLYRATLDAYGWLSARASFALSAEPAGLLYVGRDAGRAVAMAAEWSAARPDVAAEVVEGPALATLEPALAGDLVACRLSIGFPVAPSAATNAFAELAERAGAEVVVGDEVELAVEGDRVLGVRRSGMVEPAGRVVAAAGPWTPGIVDPTRRWRPIAPVWGVVASLVVPAAPRHGLEAIDIGIEPGPADERPPEPTEPSEDLVDFSLAPGVGMSALGSTFLGAEPDPSSWIDVLRRVGARYVPAIAEAPLVGVRHCARPVSRDGRPLVGRIPWLDGLWIAAGHGPWGISTGPGTARLVADALLDGDGEGRIPAALAAGRFGPPGPAGAVSASRSDR